ncbi:MAG: galactose mutarotase [Bacteroides sp.]|nr:galactose mutarotase [Bacteroides sp.]MDE5825954.1 galactose mutarotase [Duncaniella sp.]
MKAIFPQIAALGAGIMMIVSACSQQKEASLTKSGLDPDKFVGEYNGKPTALFTLENANGMEACITNFGGRIVSLMVPDRNGELRDVVLGFDSIAAYFPENNQTDFSAAIGRYANRINQGRFVIDGDTIQLPQNNFGHCLHGGPTGWQYQVYDAEQPNDSTVVLTLNSPDGDNNFPGNVTAKVTYTLTSDNSLDIAYEAVTDKPTVINMTNHAYFNLNGDPSQPITDNQLYVNSTTYTPVDSTFMTTGEILPVSGTPMDFTTLRVIGERINETDFEQIRNGNGYDHNWVLATGGDDSVVAAQLVSPSTGIVLDVLTDEPGIQVYSGNFLDGTVTGKNAKVYNQRAGICLETQHYPDSPNKPEWPSTVLRPGETYKSHTVFSFSTDKN